VVERELLIAASPETVWKLLVDPEKASAWMGQPSWSDPDNPVPAGSSTIEFELKPEGDGTRLRFVHSGLPSAEAAGSHAHGWDHYFERLEIAARGGDAGPDPWLTGDMS
jgi:uncharacterized protein YndB with AHSA1/START domain